MKLNTERLELIPLTPSQLRLWCSDLTALEQELCCTYEAEPMEGIFLEIVKGQADITDNDQDNYLWHTFWFLVRKSDRVVVGAADFKDIPDDNCEVEIGYGLGKEHEHKGYMTEAVRTMCDWALSQENVKHVTAETEADGTGSQNILKRCGFSLNRSGETLWWRL
ncbi:MAG: GNAT family N-acetyltransferase [Oscillospiraceae bacterium]|nr:GNAT family N-acetyltransferase [Oscillospiraceae bacterium]